MRGFVQSEHNRRRWRNPQLRVSIYMPDDKKTWRVVADLGSDEKERFRSFAKAVEFAHKEFGSSDSWMEN